jgi:hypothetical protein
MRYSNKEKHEAVLKSREIGVTRASQELGISAINISKWRKIESQLANLARSKDSKNRTKVSKRTRGADYPMMEAKLFTAFQIQRQHGRRVTGWWLRRRAKRWVAEFYPSAADTFVASSNWLWKFCSRYRVSWRRRTNCGQEARQSSASLRSLNACLIAFYFAGCGGLRSEGRSSH